MVDRASCVVTAYRVWLTSFRRRREETEQGKGDERRPGQGTEERKGDGYRQGDKGEHKSGEKWEGEGRKVEDEEEKKKKGLSMSMAAFFLVTQMAGAGFLALPKALAHTGINNVV